MAQWYMYFLIDGIGQQLKHAEGEHQWIPANDGISLEWITQLDAAALSIFGDMQSVEVQAIVRQNKSIIVRTTVVDATRLLQTIAITGGACGRTIATASSLLEIAFELPFSHPNEL